MLTVLARASNLARMQVEEIMGQADCDYHLKTFDSSGDRDKVKSLLDNPPRDFFTDAIDRALIAGEGDIAVHSAKDLAWPLTQGLEVIALGRCLDFSDALVSRGNLTLTALEPGARIGTSSPQRRDTLVSARSDLTIVAIRGTIEERLAQLDSGHFDALVVATCALRRLKLENRIAEILPFPAHPLQGMLAVVAREREPVLRARFAPVDHRLRYGKVWIAGAGPGDPDLITRKASAVLAQADVVYYDDLANPLLLDESRAQRVYVGKRAGAHACDQEEINRLLIESARAGKRVVRLKGGDPLIFGRGGEEAEALARCMVPFEIVPGISAVQAAAVASRVALTKRGVSSSLVLISGHDADSGAAGTTAAVYMGAGNKTVSVAKLASLGFGPNEPAVIVRNASRADQHIRCLPVRELSTDTTPSPSLILAGPACAAASLPRRILYTGLDSTACTLDGDSVAYPLIRIEPVRDIACDTTQFDGIAVTSRSAARIFFERFSPGPCRIFAIGERTADMIRRLGFSVEACAPRPDSESMAAILDACGAQRILYPCSDISRNRIHDLAQVTALPVYRTVALRREPVDLSDYDGVVFSSPSTADAFFTQYPRLEPHLNAYVYGKFTTARLIERGVRGEVIIRIPLDESE